MHQLFNLAGPRSQFDGKPTFRPSETVSVNTCPFVGTNPTVASGRSRVCPTTSRPMRVTAQ